MKHRHAELIHAWVNGAEIQWKTINGKWLDIKSPRWNADEYRVKPKMDDTWYYIIRDHQIIQSKYADSRVDADLRIVFDGETGKPKSAEVLK
jgi:hypothetical protein